MIKVFKCPDCGYEKLIVFSSHEAYQKARDLAITLNPRSVLYDCPKCHSLGLWKGELK